MSLIHNRLSHIINNISNTVQDVLDLTAIVAQQHAKRTKLFKGDSPTGLRNNIKIIKNGSMSRTVLADKDYAFYVECGNNQKGPYIYPVRAKALRFYINGSIVFAKRVRSHGELPFMRQALEYTITKIPQIVAKEFGKLFK